MVLNLSALLTASLIVCIFPMNKSAKSLAISSCDLWSGSGFICLLLVMLLTTENILLLSCIFSLFGVCHPVIQLSVYDPCPLS